MADALKDKSKLGTLWIDHSGVGIKGRSGERQWSIMVVVENVSRSGH